MKFVRSFASLLIGGLFLLACDQSGPIRIGFIAGLSGPAAETGTDSLNALQLAAQEVNEAGGIHGRMIEIIPRDDEKSPEVAQRHIREFKDFDVDAIVGPLLSAIGIAILPMINELDIVTISPTVSAAEFSGFHDNLFRMNATTRENARAYARHNLEHNRTRVASALDGENEVFSDSWHREFLLEFDQLGGRVVSKVWLNVDDKTMADCAAELLANDPDVIVLIADSSDSAGLAREIRKLDPDIQISATEWAGTETLIELGGEAVEGMELMQLFDRYDPNPRFQRFVVNYNARFGQRPGYTAVLTYEAATVLFAAMKTKHPDQPLADALTALAPQPGLQQELVFDQFGDSTRTIYFVTIRNGKFIREF